MDRFIRRTVISESCCNQDQLENLSLETVNSKQLKAKKRGRNIGVRCFLGQFPQLLTLFSNVYSQKLLLFYEFFQKILRTLFAFNFYVFSKLTFDIDVINDKRIVLLKQINSWNEEKFQSSILFKIIQSIICKFSKIDTWQRMNRYKNYFQFTQKFKIKKSPNQRILFSRGWTSRTDNILISWIRSFHRSWIQINTLFGIIQCKTTVTRIFLFSFFFSPRKRSSTDACSD